MATAGSWGLVVTRSVDMRLLDLGDLGDVRTDAVGDLVPRLEASPRPGRQRACVDGNVLLDCGELLRESLAQGLRCILLIAVEGDHDVALDQAAVPVGLEPLVGGLAVLDGDRG